MEPGARIRLVLSLAPALALMLLQLNWLAQHGPDANWPLRVLAAPCLVWLALELALRRLAGAGEDAGWARAVTWAGNFLFYASLANFALTLIWGRVELAAGLALGAASPVLPGLLLCAVVWAQWLIQASGAARGRRQHGPAALAAAADLSRRLGGWLTARLGEPLAAGMHDIATLWLPLRLVLLLVMFLAARLLLPGMELPQGAPAAPESWLGFLMRWDAFWYQDIAQNLYADKAAKLAFFPLYPLAVRGVAVLSGLSAHVAGILLSNLAAAVALAVLYAAYMPRLGRQAMVGAVVFMALWPAGHYLSGMYAESFYLLWAAAAFAAFRAERLCLCGLAGALAAASRPTGIVLLPVFMLARLMEHRRFARRDLWLLLVAAGPVAYALYCLAVFGDPLAFMRAQAGWQREFAMPWASGLMALWDVPQALALRHEVDVANLMDAGALLLALGLSGAVWRRVGAAEALFLLATVGMALTTGSTRSLARFLATAFPLFLGLGALVQARPWLRLVLAAGLGMLAAYNGVCFTLWVWTW